MSGHHALLAPSSMALTLACAASVQLQSQVPELPDTEEIQKGHAADYVAMRAAEGVLLDVGVKFRTHTTGDRLWEVDVEMRNGARIFVEAMGGFHTELRVQDPVRATAIHPEHCYGTPDAWRFFPATESPRTTALLRVGDYKNGNRYVEVFENPQLISYAVGIIERLNLWGIDELVLEFIVVSPRVYRVGGPVHFWHTTLKQLRPLIQTLQVGGAKALLPNPTATTGKHCLDCRARHACNTLRYADANIIDFSERAELETPDATAVGQELKMLRAALKRLEARETALAVHAEELLRAGKQVPHFELAPGQSRLTWSPNYTKETLAFVAELLGVNIRHPLDIFTPRQAIDAGIDEKVILEYANRPPAALKLTESSTIKTRKIFEGNKK